jgi:integrase/recombinase XerC
VNITKNQETALTARGKGDLLNMLLADKRSPNTRRAYERDLKDFFSKAFNQDPDPAAVARFLSMTREQMTFAVLDYKAELLEKELTESTVNRRITAIKSLVNFAYRTGQLNFKLDIPGEKVKAYRDTRGTDQAGIKRLMLQPDRSTLKGLRDYAILTLFWNNGLRRSEIAKLDVKDFRPETDQVFILGKGRGSQKEPVTITGQAKAVITEYLKARGEAGQSEPLFINCDRAGKGSGRLSGEALYYMVKYYSEKAGFEKPLTPHKIRHSSITAALDATGGNLRQVRRFSRHAKIETLLVYDDNREDVQGDISQLLAALI